MNAYAKLIDFQLDLTQWGFVKNPDQEMFNFINPLLEKILNKFAIETSNIIHDELKGRTNTNVYTLDLKKLRIAVIEDIVFETTLLEVIKDFDEYVDSYMSEAEYFGENIELDDFLKNIQNIENAINKIKNKFLKINKTKRRKPNDSRTRKTK